MKVSVVIPCYNEEAIVSQTADTLLAALDAQRRAGIFSDFELIFVSDGSTDKTPDRIRAAAENDRRIVPCIYEKNRGKGGAVREGILASSGDYVLYTDCDLAYGTDKIGEAFSVLQKSGADLLIGSRAIHPEGYAGYSFFRKFASVAYLRMLSLFAGFSQSDSQCGFKAMRGVCGRELFAACKTDSFAFDFEFLLRAQRAGMKISELPVKIVNHRASTVHVIRDGVRMLGDIRRIKRNLRNEKKEKQ